MPKVDLPCHYCDQWYPSGSARRQHVRNSHENLMCKCIFQGCVRKFQTVVDMAQHYIASHQQRIPDGKKLKRRKKKAQRMASLQSADDSLQLLMTNLPPSYPLGRTVTRECLERFSGNTTGQTPLTVATKETVNTALEFTTSESASRDTNSTSGNNVSTPSGTHTRHIYVPKPSIKRAKSSDPRSQSKVYVFSLERCMEQLDINDDDDPVAPIVRSPSPQNYNYSPGPLLPSRTGNLPSRPPATLPPRPMIEWPSSPRLTL